MTSFGKQLHDKGMTQGSGFPASLLSDKMKESHYFSRVDIDQRNPSKNKHKILDDDLMIVLSQDCDIACQNDNDDPLIELALFKKIKESDLYPGNQFTRSVRRIQSKVGDNWYQASISHIGWIKKKELWNVLNDFYFDQCDEDLSRVLATWRSNRYDRDPLPDRFNNGIMPYMKALLEKLNKHERYIRAVYISLDSYEENVHYIFDIFAMTDAYIGNGELEEVMNIIEEFAYEVEEKVGFNVHGDCIFALRDDAISVNKISNYRRFNLDYVSLSSEPKAKEGSVEKIPSKDGYLRLLLNKIISKIKS